MRQELRFVRSGDEPVHARSPLHLRLALATFGLVCAVAAAVLFALWGPTWLVVVSALVALVAVVDITVVLRHIRAGSRFQPGAEVPPYRPVAEPGPPPGPLPSTRPSVRHERYLLAMLVAVILLINAWTWVQAHSLTAAVVLSIAAMVLILLGVFTANVESPIEGAQDAPEPERREPDHDAHDAPEPTEHREPAHHRHRAKAHR